MMFERRFCGHAAAIWDTILSAFLRVYEIMTAGTAWKTYISAG